MASLESLVAASSERISALISKPKMSEKLLSKPPFRFLHDIISAITSTTGFAEGLFQDAELDSAAITEKQAKMDYLDKIINFVGICKGTALDIRSLKVVAGQEPENTNMFLIALAEVASDASCELRLAFRCCCCCGYTPLSLTLSHHPPPPLARTQMTPQRHCGARRLASWRAAAHQRER